MPLEISRDDLLPLINRFYAAYDSVRQFDEGYSLYSSVASGERDAVEVMNALYATYPAALSNLLCQAFWRYAPSELPAPGATVPFKSFQSLTETVQSRFQVGLDLLPSAADNPAERLSIQIREIVLSYDSSRKASDPWSLTDAHKIIETVEGELGRSIREGADEQATLKEIEQYFASQASEDAKQRAVLWKLLWEADVLNVDSVDALIAASNGNGVQATRVWRENQRTTNPRLEGLLMNPAAANNNNNNKKNNAGGAAGSTAGEASAGPADATSSSASASAAGTLHTPLPGSEARSASATDKKSLDHLRGVLERGTAALEANEKRIREKEQELEAKSERTPEDLVRFAAIRDELNEREKELEQVQQECEKSALRLNERQLQLETWEKALTMREAELAARQSALIEKEEQHLAESQKRAEALQQSSAVMLRREQMVEVKEHVLNQREAEVRRKEEALFEKDASTERRAEAIVQRSLELERHLAELELRSTRVKAREGAIWKSYVNQQLLSASEGGADSSSGGVDIGSSLGALSRDLKSVRGHLERLGTASSSFACGSNDSHHHYQNASVVTTTSEKSSHHPGDDKTPAAENKNSSNASSYPVPANALNVVK